MKYLLNMLEVFKKMMYNYNGGKFEMIYQGRKIYSVGI